MRNYIGFDVGGTDVKYSVMDEKGVFLTKGSYPSSATDFEKFKEGIISVVLENKEKYHIEGIAFSLPGGVDSETGVIGGSSALPCIHGPNFKTVFGEATNLPVEMENDANCAALGEVWKGAAKDNQDVMFLVIGTGIGGAIVKDRKIHKGAHLHGGEIGYMVLGVEEKDGTLLTKPWSKVAAMRSLIRDVAKRKGITPDELNGKKIFEAAEAGDQDCIQAIDRFFIYIAQGIYNIQYVYDPEKIIIGGAISSREDLIDQIYKRLDIILKSVGFANVRPVLEICHYQNDANLLGALFHYLQRQK